MKKLIMAAELKAFANLGF